MVMGRALVREPDLFLFDEPLLNLDAKFAWKCAWTSSARINVLDHPSFMSPMTRPKRWHWQRKLRFDAASGQNLDGRMA
jgi:hypothetical protein